MDHFDDHKTFEPLTSKPYLVADAHHVFVFLIITVAFFFLEEETAFNFLASLFQFPFQFACRQCRNDRPFQV